MKKIVIAVFGMLLLTLPAFAQTILSAEEALVAVQKQVTDGIPIEIELKSRKSGVIYEVQFFDGTGIHKIEMSALDGRILEKKWENIRQEKAQGLKAARIKFDQALATAYQELPGSTLKEAELKLRGGIPVYELEMLDNRGLLYDIAINATDGKLLQVRQDEFIINAPSITREQAEEAALSSLNGTVIYTELEEDDDKLHYEVLIFAQNALYESRVDAMNGRVLRTKLK